MPVIIDVMKDERRRLSEVVELYSKKTDEKYLKRIPEMEKDIKFLDYLLSCYDCYEENDLYDDYIDECDEQEIMDMFVDEMDESIDYESEYDEEAFD